MVWPRRGVRKLESPGALIDNRQPFFMVMSTVLMLSCQRDHFDIPPDITYLNCAYMSPLPLEATRQGQLGVAAKAHPWSITPADFFTDSERSRTLFARLIGASAGDVAIVPAVSYGMATAASNLPLAEGQSVVVLADQFPSNVYAWQQRAKAVGASLHTVPRPADGAWTRAVLDRLDASTAVVACPHCHWTDGGRLDLPRIGERCRALGVALVVDATQSLGVMPFSVAEVQPDFLVAGAYKWLLGPYSYGFVYIHPRWQEGLPLEHNWIARNGSEDFSGLVQYREDFQPGARRFDVGERSNFTLTPMVIASLELLLGWGTRAIGQYLGHLNARAATGARARGLELLPEGQRAPHLLGLRWPGGVPEDLAARFARQGIHVSIRGDAVRVSPHVYNDEADIDRFLQVLGTGAGG